jgi:hypothetical protein
VAAGTEDENRGPGHAETQGSDACPGLRLVGAALGKLRKHRVPDRQGEQGKSRDYRLPTPTKDEDVQNESEDESHNNGRDHDHAYVTAPGTIPLGRELVVRLLRGHVHVAQCGTT